MTIPLHEQRGIKYSVWLHDGEFISGWLYGQTAHGIYLALDEQAREIRFIPILDISNTGVSRGGPFTTFPDGITHEYLIEAAEFSQKLEKQLRKPLGRIDYNHTRRIGTLLSRQYNLWQPLQFDRKEPDYPSSLDQLPSTDDLFELLKAHLAFSEHINDSGVQDVLREHERRLRLYLSPHILPLDDSSVADPEQITSMIETAKAQPVATHETVAPATETVCRNARKVVDTVASEVRKPKEALELPWRLRVTSAVGRLALGATFAAVNCGLGAIAGVVSSLPSLGMGTISATMGAAASIYTGLNSSFDALDKLAGLAEKKDDDSPGHA